jgi:putative N6-adenine-specific DNA methylase
MNDSRLVITAPKGLVPFLCREITALGYPVSGQGLNYAVTRGTLRDAMVLNLSLFTAHHVLFFLREFPCASPDALYRGMLDVDWENWVPQDGYFCVVSDVEHPSIRDTRYANQRAKDAVADRMKQALGRRADSGPRQDRTVIRLYWKREKASVYIDTSGEPLNRRGYRKLPFKAPLQETLAAGLVLASGWDGRVAFVNPMCGSGTLAVEAALMALKRAPGLLRGNFGLMHIVPFDPAAWREARRAVQAKRLKAPACRIIASDISAVAVRAARKNAETAGVDRYIEFSQCDFAETPLPGPPGIIMMNPEYGMRLGGRSMINSEYRRIGDFFKRKCAGHKGYIFTGNLDAAKRIGLRARKRMVFYNAKIECRLLEYELYSGTLKKKETA